MFNISYEKMLPRVLFRVHIKYFLKYITFFYRATTKYDIDSPFVSEFIEDVYEDTRTYYAFIHIEWLRGQLLSDNRQINFLDFGAGSKLFKGTHRHIQNIAKFGNSSPSEGRLLFKLINYLDASNIVELGTSLGLSTLYMAKANEQAEIMTTEASSELCEIAAENFAKLGCGHITIINDTFDRGLEYIAQQKKSIDLLFIDGDHTYDGTIRYFKKVLPLIHSGSVIIIADIYWSDGMLKAWKELKGHPGIKLSIDTFQMGILFFDLKFKTTQHFKIVPWYFKPWHLGLFRTSATYLPPDA